MSVRLKAFLALFAAAVLWGSAGVVAKILLHELSPSVITFYRFAGSALCAMFAFRNIKLHKKRLKQLIPISLLCSINVVLFYQGLTTTSVISAAVISSTTPLVTMLLAKLLIDETINQKQAIGIVLGLCGALCIILVPALLSGKDIHGNFLGNVYVFMAVLSWSLYTIASRKLTSQLVHSPEDMTMVNFLTTGAFAGLLALIFKDPFVTPATLHLSYISLLLFAIIGLTFVTFSLFQWAVKHLSATTASLKDYIQLVIGIILSVITLHESFGGIYIVGTLLVVVGVFIATGSRLQAVLKNLLT